MFQNNDLRRGSVSALRFTMPSASRESSRSRRSNSKAKSPPPQKAPAPLRKANGVKNNLPPKSTKEIGGPKIQKDPKLYDLYADTDCKLCDMKNFKPGSDALVKHYALEHFKEKLDLEIGTVGKEFSCNLCKTRKLKSKFESRQDILLHNAIVHFRAQHLLADTLGEGSGSKASNTRRTRNRGERGKQTQGPGPGPGRSEDTSNDSVIEIGSTSGSSEGSHNGLEELSKSSDLSDKSTDLETEEDGMEEVEDLKDDDEDDDDVIEFKSSAEVSYCCCDFCNGHRSSINFELCRSISLPMCLKVISPKHLTKLKCCRSRRGKSYGWLIKSPKPRPRRGLSTKNAVIVKVVNRTRVMK